MDDLISRALILDEAKRISGPITGDGWDNWGVHGLIERQPSVPAVPLDKVCAVLAETYETPPCWKCERALGEEYCQEKECGCGSKEHWKAYFEKLMEELDDGKEPV